MLGRMTERTIVIAGSPTALGGHFDGMERGPSLLRDHGLRDRLAARPGLAGVTFDPDRCALRLQGTPVFRGGRLVYQVPPLAASRQRAIDELDRLHPAIKRLLNPHVYPVGLEKSLYDRRTELILEAKGLAA